MKTPTAEAKPYDAATTDAPLVETDKTVLPISGLGMQARKRALREVRCIPAWVAREQSEAKPKAKPKAKSSTKTKG